MRVLVAVGASPNCDRIVASVVSRPWPPGTRFILLHVLDPFPFVKAPISLQWAKETAESRLRDLSRSLSSCGWKVEFEVVLGQSRQAIPNVASFEECDLIVLGANEATALARFLLGSTAQVVLRHAPCSVEILRPGPAKQDAGAKGLKILVATDGSECSSVALRSVASRSWPEGSSTKVIAIPGHFGAFGKSPVSELEEIERQNRLWFEEAISSAVCGAEILSKAGLNAIAEAPTSSRSPSEEIIYEAKHWPADLIVVGSHGRHGLGRLAIGSVSEYVALHAPCSVEVMREQQSKERSKTMKVCDVMTATPYSCQPEANLGRAAELMWRGNCGFLPVVESDGKVVGVVTDRDICIALGTRGMPPGDVIVADVMTSKIYACAPEDDIHEALREMRQGHVRRLPVVTRNGALAGVVSMDDVLLHAEAGTTGRTPELSMQEVVKTMQAINVRQLPTTTSKRAAA